MNRDIRKWIREQMRRRVNTTSPELVMCPEFVTKLKQNLKRKGYRIRKDSRRGKDRVYLAKIA